MTRWNGEARLGAAVCAAGGRHGHAREMFAVLSGLYGEPHRHYHTMGHVQKCLTWLDRYRECADDAAEVELALWYHDAIYDPRRTDNECRSAELFAQHAARAGLPRARLERVQGLILATAVHEAVTADQSLTVSIDLAILGAAPSDYRAFEAAIRREYAHVPEIAFARGRCALLEGLLRKPAIYPCRPIREQLEARARDNLADTLRRLGCSA